MVKIQIQGAFSMTSFLIAGYVDRNQAFGKRAMLDKHRIVQPDSIIVITLFLKVASDLVPVVE